MVRGESRRLCHGEEAFRSQLETRAETSKNSLPPPMTTRYHPPALPRNVKARVIHSLPKMTWCQTLWMRRHTIPPNLVTNIRNISCLQWFKHHQQEPIFNATYFLSSLLLPSTASKLVPTTAKKLLLLPNTSQHIYFFQYLLCCHLCKRQSWNKGWKHGEERRVVWFICKISYLKRTEVDMRKMRRTHNNNNKYYLICL